MFPSHGHRCYVKQGHHQPKSQIDGAPDRGLQHCQYSDRGCDEIRLAIQSEVCYRGSLKES
jgi:hypothetical protein